MKVDNFTQLGSSAPAKKMIKFTGTTAALADPNQYTQITHGLTASKILRVDVVVELGGAGNVQQDYTQSAGYKLVYLLKIHIFMFGILHQIVKI